MTPRLFALEGDPASRAWLATGVFMLAFLAVIAPAALMDDRLLNGVSVWAKPVKFCLALSIHFLTLALLVQMLAPARRRSALIRGAVFASVAAALFEIIYIAVQAARARKSHFNFETGFESLMYAAMGVGALVLVFAPLIVGVMLARQRDSDRSGLKLGAVLGLIIGPLATIAFAGYMSYSGSHFVGAPGHTDAGGIALFGWSRDAADLRPAHFIATHMMQMLPLTGYAADRLAPALARPAVWAATIILGVAAAILFALTLAGQPVLGWL